MAVWAGLASGSALAFDLQGHRGARGLAPENTIAGFKTALRIGVDTLELDLAMTRDGVLVVSHDPRLNPAITRDASGRWLEAPGPAIMSLSLAELQRYDVGRLKPDTDYARAFPAQRPADGERIPTLEAVFETARATAVRFNIETKLTPDSSDLAPAPEAFAEALVAVVRRHGLQKRVTVQSFDWRTLRAVQKLAPEIATAALTTRQPRFDNIGDGRWTAGLRVADHGDSVPRLVKASGARLWSPFHGDLTEAQLAEARQLGLLVVPWTVNEPAAIERLLAWGVDGLISDHPDRVRQAMAARGMTLPRPLDLP